MLIANVAKSPAGPAEAPAQAIRPRVFIASDVRLLCDGLVLSLSQQPSVTAVGSAGCGERVWPIQLGFRGRDTGAM